MKLIHINTRSKLYGINLHPLLRAGIVLLSAAYAFTYTLTQTAASLLLDSEAPPASQARAQASRPELVLQTGLTSPAGNIIFSPDGRLLASMGIEGSTIKLWEVSSGRQLRSLNLGPRSFLSNSNTVAFNFTPDGRLLACLNSEKIRLWDVE